MATRKPLVVVSGQVQELPAGDIPAGAEPSISAAVSTPTEKYWRGDKTWRDFFTDVRAATLTGLSTATNAVVAATDTMLAAIGKLQAQVSSKFDKAGGDVAGNINFTGTARRIAGDFSNATIANRLLFQSNVPNGATAVFAIPNGSEVISNFSAVNKSDPANAAIAQMAALGGEVRISSFASGSGTVVPMTFHVGPAGERLRIDTNGNVTATSGALGYGTGTGGTAAQPTSKSTPVYLNKPCGAISMHNASLAAGASVEFSLNNNLLATGDGLVVNPDGVTGYAVEVAYFNSATEVVLRVTNKGTTRSDPVIIRFRIFKGALS